MSLLKWNTKHHHQHYVFKLPSGELLAIFRHQSGGPVGRWYVPHVLSDVGHINEFGISRDDLNSTDGAVPELGEAIRRAELYFSIRYPLLALAALGDEK